MGDRADSHGLGEFDRFRGSTVHDAEWFPGVAQGVSENEQFVGLEDGRCSESARLDRSTCEADRCVCVATGPQEVGPDAIGSQYRIRETDDHPRVLDEATDERFGQVGELRGSDGQTEGRQPDAGKRVSRRWRPVQGRDVRFSELTDSLSLAGACEPEGGHATEYVSTASDDRSQHVGEPSKLAPPLGPCLDDGCAGHGPGRHAELAGFGSEASQLAGPFDCGRHLTSYERDEDLLSHLLDSGVRRSACREPSERRRRQICLSGEHEERGSAQDPGVEQHGATEACAELGHVVTHGQDGRYGIGFSPGVAMAQQRVRHRLIADLLGLTEGRCEASAAGVEFAFAE